MKSVMRVIISVLVLQLGIGAQVLADTLDDVRTRGQLLCGVNTGLPGFSEQDGAGRWRGLDVDLCRAVAAAVLQDPEKVKFVPLTAQNRFDALEAGKVDLLARNTTWTMGRDISLDVEFVGTSYYDGQGFLVPRTLGVRSALELNGAEICVQAGTTSEVNVKQYFTVNRMKARIHLFETPAQSLNAYENGKCTVFTSDQSQLYALRTRLKDPQAAIVLPEFISKEPLGPVVREGDGRWADIVQWSLFAMINAEELGIDSANVDRVKESAQDPSIRRLLGVEGDWGVKLGLENQWVYHIIKRVGNYGESFDRNLGRGSPIKIRRGQNALWRDGGLLFAPPIN